MVRTKTTAGIRPNRQPRPREESRMTRVDASALFANRGAIQEKHFPPSSDCAFYDIAKSMGLGELMKKRNKANLTLVREFYTCYAMDDRMGITARGGEFYLTRESIQAFYHIPRVPRCRYISWLEDEDRVPWEQVFSVIGIEGATWSQRAGGRRCFERKNMNDEARIWLNFMTYNVMAQAHISDITEDGAALLFLLMTQQPVDIAYVIIVQIRNCMRNARTSLVYPHMITDMCKDHGIPNHSSDILLNPSTTRIYLTSQVNRERKRGKRPIGDPEEEEDTEEGTEAAAAGEGGSSFTLAGLSAQIAGIGQQLTALTTHAAALDQKFEEHRATTMANELRRQRLLDPLILELARAQQITLPPDFASTFWSGAVPHSSYFHPGPGQSSGAAAEVAEQAGAAEEEADEETPAGGTD